MAKVKKAAVKKSGRKQYQCGACQGLGHNARTCKKF